MLYQNHALFLLNYATINDDNSFNIWDHAVLEHWDRKISNRYPRGIFYRPPDDLPTRYYPLKGLQHIHQVMKKQSVASEWKTVSEY